MYKQRYGSIESRVPQIDVIIAACFERAKEAMKKDRPNVDRFSDSVSQAEIEADKVEVRRLQGLFAADRSFSDSAKRLATIWEAYLTERVELDAWFGMDGQTMVTTDYDDIKNGVDGVVEFGGDEGTHIGFDATYSIHSLDSKIDRICDNIRRGSMAQVKYFESPDTEEKRSLNDIPLVVITLDKENIEEVATIWVNYENDSSKRSELRRVGEGIKLLAIEQVLAQLLAYSDYARQGRQVNLYRICTDAANVIWDSVREALQDFDSSMMPIDKQHRALMNKLNTITSASIVPKGYRTVIEALRAGAIQINN